MNKIAVLILACVACFELGAYTQTKSQTQPAQTFTGCTTDYDCEQMEKMLEDARQQGREEILELF